MFTLLTTFHILIAVILILVILLQSARGADVAGVFGGMGSQTAFGPRGTATFLSKATVVLMVLFMLTSVSLAILSNRMRGGGGGGGSVLGNEAPTETQPAAPAPVPAVPPPQVHTETIPPAQAPGSPAQPAQK